MTRLFAVLAATIALFAAAPAAAAAAASCPVYETEGTGPDVLLVPGLASSPETYDDMVAALKDRYRFHRVAIAGFAGTPATSGNPVATAEADIVRYIGCAKLTAPALIGHSLGGFVGQEIARDHPGLLSRLIIVDVLPFYPLIFDPAATTDAIRPQAAAITEQLRRMDDAMFAAWSIASDRNAMADAMATLMTTDLRPDLAGITLPVTVLYATNEFVPEARAKALFEGPYAKLPDVRFVPIADSRHFIMFDQPEAFAQAIDAALSPQP